MPTATIEVIPPPEPADPLPALERELALLIAEHQALRAAWPKAPHVLERASIGRKVEDTAKRIAEIERAITETQATTPAGAAVQLRRLVALLDWMEPGPRTPPDCMAVSHRLLASALAAVEAA